MDDEQYTDELPRHEGYHLDERSHHKRRTSVFLVAGIMAVFVAGAWIWMMQEAMVLPQNVTGEGVESLSEIQNSVAEKFSSFTEQILPNTEEKTAAKDAGTVDASLIESLRLRVFAAAATTSSATSSPLTPADDRIPDGN